MTDLPEVLRNLQAQGEILIPKCRKGMTVWITDTDNEEPAPTKVIRIMYDSDRPFASWIYWVGYQDRIYSDADIDKRLFLNKPIL